MDQAADQAKLARALIDQLPAMVAYWDAELRCRFANRDYERWFGVTPEWLLGKHISELLGPLYPLNLPYIEGALRGERQEFEREIPDPAGGPSRHSLAYYLPDVSGGLVRGFFVLVTDITRRVRAEQLVRQRERQLQAAERVASMATLAAGLAHELNNPLASITVNLELVAGQIEAGELDPKRTGTLVAEARSDAARISSIVQGMKLLARSDKSLEEAFDVARVLEQSVRLVWNDLRYRASLTRRIEGVGSVRGSALQLAQVVVSLLRNAAESFTSADVEQNQIVLRAQREGDWIVVEVSDNGCGIAAELQQKIFEPFFTTKDVGSVGLGLSISRSIALAFGGELSVRSRVGEGSTFRLRLPAAADELVRGRTSEAPAPERASSRTAKRARILIVDDEPHVCAVLTRILAADYDVRISERARAAVELISAPGANFDLILCDIMMPELTGADIYEAVTGARPELARQFAFMSGGAFTARTRQFIERVRVPVLDKPFTVDQVRAFVEAQLAKPR